MTNEITIRPDDARAIGAHDAPTMVQLPQQAENYVSGFEGAAVYAFDQKIRDSLSEPVDPDECEIRPDGIVFLPGIFYRARLFKAFGAGGWALMPRRPAMRIPNGKGELVVYFGALYCLGRYVGEAAGQCMYFPGNRGMTYADAYEGAKTDAITRCCKDLGIAHELWDQTWRGQWMDRYAVQDREGDWHRRDATRKDKLGAPLPIAFEKAPIATIADNVPSVAPGDSPTVAPDSTPTATRAEAMIDKAKETFGTWKARGDTGVMPSDQDLADMQDLVFEKLKLDDDTVFRFLFTSFGTRNPRELTKANVRAAFRLLLLWGNREGYKAQIEKERADGQIV